MPRLILPAAAQTSRPGTQAEAPQNTDRVVTDELITGQFLKRQPGKQRDGYQRMQAGCQAPPRPVQVLQVSLWLMMDGATTQHRGHPPLGASPRACSQCHYLIGIVNSQRV